jgi:hypothetical protein
MANSNYAKIQGVRVVEMEQRNPIWGCPDIADEINLAFGTSLMMSSGGFLPSITGHCQRKVAHPG